MSGLPYGSALCQGVMTNATYAPPCLACLRRISKPQHVWQKWIVAPAVRVGNGWSCAERVGS